MRIGLALAGALLVLGFSPAGLSHAAAGQAASAQAPAVIDPQRFAEEIQAFDAEDKAAMPPEGAIVITGSSSVRRWHPTIKEDLAGLTVIPRGFGGSTMEDALYWIDRLAITYKPRAVVLYEGDNDTSARYSVPPEKIVQQFEAIVAKIHTALPKTRIYVVSVKPSVSRLATWPQAVATNKMLEALAAKDPLITYIDVATPMLQPNGQVMTDIFVDDDLHLNPKGYVIWSKAIRDVLMKHEAAFERTN
jgi:lysophospholipase L1-like esterase